MRKRARIPSFCVRFLRACNIAALLRCPADISMQSIARKLLQTQMFSKDTNIHTVGSPTV